MPLQVSAHHRLVPHTFPNLPPLSPSSRQHTVVSVLFLFLFSFPSMHNPSIPPDTQRPHPLELSTCPLSMCLSLCGSCVHFAYSSPQTSEILWYLFCFDWLFHFAKCSLVHSCCCKAWYFLIFYNPAVFRCVNVPLRFYPLAYPWALGLLPEVGDCK